MSDAESRAKFAALKEKIQAEMEARRVAMSPQNVAASAASMMDEATGDVYVLINRWDPEYVRIDHVSDWRARMEFLRGAAADPKTFEMRYVVRVFDAERVVAAARADLAEHAGPNEGWFRVTPDEAIAAVKRHLTIYFDVEQDTP
jgi:hypothetical protein